MSEEHEENPELQDSETPLAVADAHGQLAEPLDDEVESHRMTLLAKIVAWLPVVICFLGTGQTSLMLGLTALIVGLLVFFNPPQTAVPWLLLLVMGSVAVLTALPLIPVPTPFPPAWKVHLIEDAGIKLGATTSPQPWVTLERWLWLMVMMVWFLWLTTQQSVTDARSHVVRAIAAGISWLAVVALVLHALHWTPPTWESSSPRDIGSFPNRNHFSTLMAMNAMLCLACAYDLLRRKKRQWWYYALGLVPCFAVVLVNTSRAGLILFFAGIVLWFATSAVRKRSLKRLAIGGAFLLACTTGTVLFAQSLLSRFTGSEGQGFIEHLSDDARGALYLDTLEMILQHPVLGVGLGNFGSVFGLVNHLHMPDLRFEHPESDVLWFVAEAGWPAMMAVAVGLLLFLRWIGPWRVASKSTRRRERRLRLTAGLAVLMVFAHGLVDVPLHGTAMAMMAGLLGALALYGTKVAQSRGAMIPGLLKAGGVLAVAAGVGWIMTAFGFNTPMGSSVWAREMAVVRRASLAQVVTTGKSAVDNAIRNQPLNWEAYFYRASIGLRMGWPVSAAMEDFGRARYLEPNLAQMCMAEAEVWLRHQPLLAVPAWREALRRDPSEAQNRYREILSIIRQSPELRGPVRELATDARLELLYLGSVASEPEFKEVLADLLSRFPALEGLNHFERGQLFTYWRSKGDRKALVAALEAHQDWQEDGWMALALEYAEAGKPQKAYELAMAHVSNPTSMVVDPSHNLEALQRDYAFNPSDARRGFSLALLQRDRHLYPEALATLDKIAAQKSAPKNVYYEMALVHARMSNFVKAWENLVRYLQS